MLERLNKPLPEGRWWTHRLAQWVMAIVLAGFFVSLWLIRHAPILGADGLIYHAALPAFWLQRGFLAPVDLPFHDGIAQFSPFLSETLTYLLMRLSGDDGLIWLIQPACFLLVLWCYYRTCTAMDVRAELALLLTASLGLFSTFHSSLVIVNNDLVLTAGGAIFLCGLVRTGLPRGWPVLLAACGIAVLLTTKYIGLIYAAIALLLLVPAAMPYLRRRARMAGARRALTEVAASGAVILAGAIFLIRNWILHGSPTYPSILKLGGHALFRGLYDTSVYARVGLSWPHIYRMLFDDDLSLFGVRPTYGMVLLVAILLANVFFLLGPRRNWRAYAACMVFPVLAVALHFRLTPFWQEHRLLFPVYLAMWLSPAYVLGVIRRDGDAAVRVPLAGLLLVLTALHLYLVWWLSIEWLAVVAAVALAGAVFDWRRVRLWWVGAALAGAVLIAAATSPSWYAGYRAERAGSRAVAYRNAYSNWGAGWAVIDAATRRNGPATVGYAGCQFIYALFGADLKNHPVYVPLSPDDHPQPTPLVGDLSIGLQEMVLRRKTVDEEYWLAGLKEKNVRLLFLCDDHLQGGVQQELGIIHRHSGQFQLLAQFANVYVYAVRP